MAAEPQSNVASSELAPLCFRSLSSFSPALILKFHRKETGNLLVIPCLFLVSWFFVCFWGEFGAFSFHI